MENKGGETLNIDEIEDEDEETDMKERHALPLSK
jgi:hypothetical protein